MRITLATLLFALPTAVAAQSPDLSQALERYKQNGAVNWEQVRLEYEQAERQKKLEARTQTSTSTVLATPPKPTSVFLLRQSFSDIHLFDDPVSAAEAKGASFSWTDDAVARDRAWSVNGMVAAAFSIPGDYSRNPGASSLLGVNLISYAQLKRETHSNNPKKNADASLLGGGVEFGIDTPAAGQHYLRFTSAYADDAIKGATFVSSKAEWLPVIDKACIGYPCSLFPVAVAAEGAQIFYRFNPSLQVLYDRALQDTSPVPFSERDRAMRIGPELNLVVHPFTGNPALLSNLFDVNRFYARATYRWSQETVSERTYRWFETSLTYNLGKTDHLGLTASYQKGSDWDTADRTEIFKLALTGKF